MTRSGHKFDDGKQWLYSCSCNREKLHFLNSLGAEIRYSYSKFNEEFSNCIHIDAAIHVLTKIDAVHCIMPDMDFEGTVNLVVC